MTTKELLQWEIQSIQIDYPQKKKVHLQRNYQYNFEYGTDKDEDAWTFKAEESSNGFSNNKPASLGLAYFREER